MKIPLTLDSGISLLALGLLPADTVALLATLALESGVDTLRIRQLAGGPFRQDDDPVETLGLALSDAGVSLPARNDAARQIATTVSSDILSGRVDPFEAATSLAEVSRAVGLTFHDLDPFIYAASEGQDRTRDREHFRHAIITEAQCWARTEGLSTDLDNRRIEL